MLPVWLAINGSAKLVRLCCCAANDHWCGIYRPVASVSASVPLFRLDDAQRYAAPLMKAVLEISKRLGYIDPSWALSVLGRGGAPPSWARGI